MNIGSFLLANGLNGLMAIAMLLIGFFVFNVLTPNWDFTDVFKTKGVSGGAVVVAAFLLGLSIVIAAAGF
ncbi:MAG: DUF350 domain-containing protein [Desulfobacteraceae bacterium]|nr:DUF350 domain-containing protein [Desulfobacteraceae bacterium]